MSFAPSRLQPGFMSRHGVSSGVPKRSQRRYIPETPSSNARNGEEGAPQEPVDPWLTTLRGGSESGAFSGAAEGTTPTPYESLPHSIKWNELHPVSDDARAPRRARNQDDGLGEAAAPGSVASTIPPVLRTARAVAEALQTSGAFEREFSTRFRTADTLGFSARGIGTDAVWQSVVVTRVTEWGQAHSFGVLVGDVITRVGGADTSTTPNGAALCDSLLRSAKANALTMPFLEVVFARPRIGAAAVVAAAAGAALAAASSPAAAPPLRSCESVLEATLEDGFHSASASPAGGAVRSVHVSRNGSVTIERDNTSPRTAFRHAEALASAVLLEANASTQPSTSLPVMDDDGEAEGRGQYENLVTALEQGAPTLHDSALLQRSQQQQSRSSDIGSTGSGDSRISTTPQRPSPSRIPLPPQPQSTPRLHDREAVYGGGESDASIIARVRTDIAKAARTEEQPQQLSKEAQRAPRYDATPFVPRQPSPAAAAAALSAGTPPRDAAFIPGASPSKAEILAALYAGAAVMTDDARDPRLQQQQMPPECGSPSASTASALETPPLPPPGNVSPVVAFARAVVSDGGDVSASQRVILPAPAIINSRSTATTPPRSLPPNLVLEVKRGGSGSGLAASTEEEGAAAAAMRAVLAKSQAESTRRGNVSSSGSGLVVQNLLRNADPQREAAPQLSAASSALMNSAPIADPPSAVPVAVRVTRHGSININVAAQRQPQQQQQQPENTPQHHENTMKLPSTPQPWRDTEAGINARRTVTTAPLPIPAHVSIHPAVLAVSEEIIATRRYFHSTPELGFQEATTASHIELQLSSCGFDQVLTGVGDTTGVVAELWGRKRIPASVSPSASDRRFTAFRADMDGLPVVEKGERAVREGWASSNGVMHACGHDGHMAILLHVAALLALPLDKGGVDVRAALPVGRGIRFVFQPAEEGGGGAKYLIKGGCLNSVDAIYGLHLWNPMEVGTVGVAAGAITANSDRFQITVKGSGGHGSMPHMATDPVVAAAELIMAIQTIASRASDPFFPFVISIGTVNGGSAPNILAQEVALTGTVRSTRENERSLAKRRLSEICAGISASSGALCTLAYRDGYPATVSTPAEADIVRAAALTVVGDTGVVPPHKTLAGEDMSYYLQRIPGAFFFVGSSPNALVADSLIPGGRYAGVESGSGSESAAETAAAAARVSRFQLPGLGGAPAGAIDTASTLLSATELRQSKLGTIVSHHMDTFDIDERALLIGASVLLEIALKDTV